MTQSQEFLFPFFSRGYDLSQTPKSVRSPALFFLFKIFSFDSHFPYNGYPNPSFSVVSFISFLLCCLIFFKAGYPALVINPVCNSLCHASFSLVSCSYWEQWDGQMAIDTRGMTGYADYHVSSHVSCRVGHWVIVKQEF